jgi:replicative DNA helicase
MPDDYTTRLEQGILAALLAGDDQRLLSDHLAVSDFANPTHQAIYQAIVELDPDQRTPDRLVTAVAATVREPGVSVDWLRDLADQAPQPQRASAYAQILIQTAFDRDAATFATPYLAAAQQTTDPLVRDDLTRLGAALTARAEAFTTVTGGPHPDPAPVGLEPHREDQIIADLLQHPEQARAVAEWLDSEVFTTEQRKVTFEIAVSLAYDHDPIDAVILTWHVEQARSLAVLDERPPQPPGPPGEANYTYLTRLESTPVTPGTAITVGRDLLAEHLRTKVALSAAQAAERATRAQLSPQRTQQIASEAPLSATANIDLRPIER